MLQVILGNLAVFAVTIILARTGVLGEQAKNTAREVTTYNGCSSFIAFPTFVIFVMVVVMLPSAWVLMLALGILHIHMSTIFTESYSFYDSLHIDLALTLIIIPVIISSRMRRAQERKYFGS